MPTLADVYSAIDTAKRRGSDFFQNPVTSLQQMLGSANDRAREFNKLSDLALIEFQKTGKISGPQQMELAQQLASGYSPAGMTVWHGSPYKFKAFDPAKIGTGEGAQAYGHGIYVAESPTVATGYKEKLSQNRLFDTKGAQFDVQANLLNPNVRAVLNKTNGDIDAAIARARQSIESIPGTQGAEYAAKDIETLNAIKASGGLQKQSGNLYKIDLPDEHIAKMLDWDKPLSQQQHIMEALTPENMGLTLRPSVNNGYMAYVADGKPIGLQVKGVTPEVFRQRWLERLAEFGNAEGGAGRAIGYLGGTSTSGDLAPTVVNAIRQAGIPGIKYLDEGSRGAKNGTRNFVVFPGNEHLLQIQDINGNPIQ